MDILKTFSAYLLVLASLPAFCQNSAQSIFDGAYWAHQPPAVATCQTRCSPSQAIALANQGYQIDVAIDVWGGDPYAIMTDRASYGFTWVPALGQAQVTILPGLSQAGVQSYNPTPPSGSILVSTNPADYPPFVPPAPISAPAATPLVGGQELGCMYYALDGGKVASGSTVNQGGKTYTKFAIPTPFGLNSYFMLNECTQ